MTTIYENVASLVQDAVNTTLSAATNSSTFDYSPKAVKIAPTNLISVIPSVILPSAPTYSNQSVPLPDIKGSLSKASYNAVSSVLTGFNVSNLPSSLAYQIPVRPDALPDYGIPASPGQPPQTGFISVLDSAGLTPVESPVITVGLPPDLEPIPTLSYTTYGFDMLNVSVPVPTEVPSIDMLSDPEKLVVTLEPRLLSAIQHTLSGQDIMDVQQQLYNLATHDLRRERVNVERKLFSESAANGFDDANGPLFEKLADVNYESRLKDGESYEEGRDFLYDAAKKKLVAAIQQSIALETANFAVHMAYASKLVEVFEINAELHNQVFNLVVEMYTLQLQATNAVIDAYNTYVGVVVAEQQAETAELSVARAKLQSNKARIAMYRAQGQTAGVRADVFETDVQQSILPLEEYTTYIDGLLVNVDIQQENIKAYKDGLAAYADAMKVDKAKIDAYGAQIRAEGSAVEVYKENWDLYSGAYSALSGQNSAISGFNRDSLQALNAEIGVFRAAADEQGAYLRAISAWAEQNRGASGDYSRGVNQAVSYLTGSNKTTLDLVESKSRVDLYVADIKSTQSALTAQRQAAQASIDAGLAASTATTYAGQAQAAYSVRSISAGLGSTASDAESSNFNSRASIGNSYTKSYSYSKSGAAP